MSVTVIPTPAGVSWIELRCRLGVLVADGADADRYPDAHAVTGKVRLTVNTPSNRIKWQEADGGWRSLDLPGIEYDVNAEGRLVSPDGVVGVFVPDPLSTNLDPREYTITALVRPDGGAAWSVTIGGALAMASPVDLVHYSTVTPSPGVSSLEARVAALEAGGDSLMGGQYIDASGDPHPFVFVVSDADPGQTRTIDDKVYEVWWVQTAPPDPAQWIPKQVSQNLAGRSYTIPADDGATYTIDGAAKAAGTYAVSTDAATTLAWAAVAKPGYTFKAGAETSGSMVWPEKVWVSGDVLMSDSFNRADGPLIGSLSDSFEGGTPRPWTGPDTTGAIVGGAMKPTGTFFRPEVHVYSTPQDNIRIEWVYATVPGSYGEFKLQGSGGTISVQKDTVYHSSLTGGNGNKWYTPPLPAPKAGDRLAAYSTTTLEGWRKWTLENLTTGAKVSGVNAPAPGNQLPGDGGALDGSGLKITKIEWGGRGDDSSVGALDLVVVKIP